MSVCIYYVCTLNITILHLVFTSHYVMCRRLSYACIESVPGDLGCDLCCDLCCTLRNMSVLPVPT